MQNIVHSCILCNRRFRSKEALIQHQKDSPKHEISVLSSDKAVGNHRRDVEAHDNVNKPAQETREYFMFPELHEHIEEAVFPDISSTWFCKDENGDKSHREWFTRVMGKFTCNNSHCKKKGWFSKMVPIEIRGYGNNGYNAVVFNQRCKRCDRLGSFMLDEMSYIERVAHRLKIWAGVEMERVNYTKKKGPPHETRFCEGCKRGKCKEDY